MGHMPEPLLRARTTLLPKNERPATPAEYRPITVASVAVRQLHRILGVRLEGVVEHAGCQRGLRRGVDGIGQNITALDDILKHARKKRKEVRLAMVDVEKAFDRLSHSALMNIMSGRGWPSRLVKYVEQVYLNATTQIGGGQPIRVRRGIRQGDPLSSVLFNIAMDHALMALPERVGYLLGGRRVGALAFADDVVLVAMSEVGLVALLKALVRGLREVGLNISAAKSLYVPLVSRGRRLVVPREGASVEAEGVTLVSGPPNRTWSYLGIRFGVAGVVPFEIRKVERAVAKVDRAPLKPLQKLEMVRTHVLPSFMHGLVLTGLPLRELEGADVVVRRYVRKWLRLPIDSANAYLHGPVGDGGMGIMRLASTVPVLRRQRLAAARLCLYGDQYDFVWETGLQRRAKRALKLHGMVDGVDLIGSRGDRASTAWIRDGGLAERGWRSLSMVRVHSGSIPSRVRVSRGRRDHLPIECRWGCRAKETAAHAVQVCPVTRLARVGRHNYAVGLLLNYARKKGWTVWEEPHFQLANRGFRPDAVVSNSAGVFVLEVAVAGGRGQSLVDVCTRKATKYDTPEVRRAVAGLSGCEAAQVKVVPVVLSWKGIWHPASVAAAKVVGFPAFVMAWIAAGVLAGSAMVWSAFVGEYRRRRRGRPPRP